MIYITDRDARAAERGESGWGICGIRARMRSDELNRIMQVRAKALQDFSEQKIRFGVPMSTLEEVLVPVYMFHRYQLEAAAKVVGGLELHLCGAWRRAGGGGDRSGGGAAARARRADEDTGSRGADAAGANPEAASAASARDMKRRARISIPARRSRSIRWRRWRRRPI